MSTTLTVGDISIHRVVEQEGPFFDVLKFFPTLTPELLEANAAWLVPKFIDGSGKLILCVQSYLVRTKHHTILVDSCVGNHKPRPNRPFWHMLASAQYERNLAAAGVGVGDIDYVMCTHLHTDHVGWNTRLENGRWVPTFPKAKYLFSDRELAFWSEKEKGDPAGFPWITDSVLPVVAAGRSETVKSDYKFSEVVQLVPTPGHSIDHFSVLVGTSGQDALITGDMIHSPLQGLHPEIGMFSDYDSKQAGQSRRAVLERFCDTATTMCLAHFPSPSMARISRWGEGFKFTSV